MYQINNRHDARIFERKVRNRYEEKYVFRSVLITCWRPNDIDNSQTEQHHDTKCIPQIEHNTRWLKIHHNFCVVWVRTVSLFLSNAIARMQFSVRVWDVDVLLLFQSIYSIKICSCFRFSFSFFEHLFAPACDDGGWRVLFSLSFLTVLLFLYRSVRLSWSILIIAGNYLIFFSLSINTTCNNPRIYVFQLLLLFSSMQCYTLFNGDIYAALFLYFHSYVDWHKVHNYTYSRCLNNSAIKQWTRPVVFSRYATAGHYRNRTLHSLFWIHCWPSTLAVRTSKFSSIGIQSSLLTVYYYASSFSFTGFKLWHIHRATRDLISQDLPVTKNKHTKKRNVYFVFGCCALCILCLSRCVIGRIRRIEYFPNARNTQKKIQEFDSSHFSRIRHTY